MIGMRTTTPNAPAQSLRCLTPTEFVPVEEEGEGGPSLTTGLTNEGARSSAAKGRSLILS
jgi:hypothetical protein